jgi:methylenetetrahydrofolate reductase (NADPH)
MNNDVPGVFIPEALLKRMEAAGDGAEEEGVQIALELIAGVRKMQGVHGLHIMAVNWEEIVPRIVTEAGLLPEGFVPPPPQAESKKVKVVAN